MSTTFHYCEPLSIEDVRKAIPEGVLQTVPGYPFLFTWTNKEGKLVGVWLEVENDGICVNKPCERNVYNGQWEFQSRLEAAGHNMTYSD